MPKECTVKITITKDDIVNGLIQTIGKQFCEKKGEAYEFAKVLISAIVEKSPIKGGTVK